MTAKWHFWIDRGGTFTDIVCQDPDGSLRTRKLLSEHPGRYKDAAIQGIRDLLGLAHDAPIPRGQVGAVKMGTTVATNALLERKGDRTLLLITHGFGDLLRIGTQARPTLFDLNIHLPELLYERVAEVPERLAADGSVLTALDETATRAALRAARADGVDSVAIAFLHGYLNPDHEARAAAIAAEEGFGQISVSHQVSPLIKLVSRGDTTVVDAYLSPILRRYVDQVAGALDMGRACERLLFMQSSGGLTDAQLFQGKDAILSGPAGGIVGMVKTGEAAAGIVYATDAKISDAVHVVFRFPAKTHQPIRYVGGVIGKAPAKDARAFLAYLNGGRARAILARYGFLPPGSGE